MCGQITSVAHAGAHIFVVAMFGSHAFDVGDGLVDQLPFGARHVVQVGGCVRQVMPHGIVLLGWWL